MEEIELVNGNWPQTTASILYNINKKLNSIDLDSIITKIDQNTKSDINILKLDTNVIKSDINVLHSDSNTIKYNISSILNRVNSLSIVKEIRTIKEPIMKERLPFRNNTIQKKPSISDPVYFDEKMYIIDMDLRQGYSESYKIDLPYGHTYDTRLSWLISGDKRRLLWRGELTNDIILIYNSLGITDINIIKKSKLS
jgi:hypothetical protein